MLKLLNFRILIFYIKSPCPHRPCIYTCIYTSNISIWVMIPRCDDMMIVGVSIDDAQAAVPTRGALRSLEALRKT